MRVATVISRIGEEEIRKRCLSAYDYLMAQDETSSVGVYKQFVLRHESLLDDWEEGRISKLPYVNEGELCVEAALFPHLYPTRECCDSYARQQSENSSAIP
eukprot:GHVS01033089.1.p1 GENE.GHVS01033089.1~~GHVS01033089.1.p1  ORF type:complete len:101 (-),score=12.90 GHVS01033089.1:84-386(-)